MKRYLLTKEDSEGGKKKRKSTYQRHLLTSDGKSWVDVIDVPGDAEETLKDLLACKPLVHGTVIMRGKVVNVPRFQAIYGRSYTFSGQDHPVEKVTPEVVQRFMDWANTTKYVTERTDGFQFNNVVGNWYMNGHHYIGAHSDDETQLHVTDKGDTVILGANYGSARTVRFRPKRTGEEGSAKLDLVLKPGTGYVMGGRTQKTHTHAIVKISGKKGESVPPRVSLTARCFV